MEFCSWLFYHYLGCEIDGNDCKNYSILVNPGLGMAAPAGLELYKEILDYYDKQKFCDADGSINTTTVVTRTTQILLERGLKNRVVVKCIFT